MLRNIVTFFRLLLIVAYVLVPLFQRVLDTDNWIMDLDYANTYDDPQFTLLYTAKEAYGSVTVTFLPGRCNVIFEICYEECILNVLNQLSVCSHVYIFVLRMDDLSPASWNNFVEEMKTPNSTAFDLFFK